MEAHHTAGPRDVVLQLFVIATLYAIAVHVGILVHQLVNAWVPDPVLERAYGPFEPAHHVLRYTLAMLVVFVPIHAWARRAMHRLVDGSAEVRALRSRRWLGTITIAIAGIILAGDFVAVINRFLEGEITLRFSLKAASVLLIAAAVLWYERAELHRQSGAHTRTHMRTAGTAMLAAIGVAVLAGFIVSGSPASLRRAQIDLQRVNDLSGIQWNIVSAWQRTGVLPLSLDELRDDISGYVPPRDPVTGEPYEYAQASTDMRSFTLCATFSAENTITHNRRSVARPAMPYEESVGVPIEDAWQHPAGRHCYTRTIDLLRYPVNPIAPIKPYSPPLGA